MAGRSPKRPATTSVRQRCILSGVEDARNPYGVEVGQAWACRVARFKGRVFRITEIVLDDKEPYARAVMISDSAPAYASRVGHRTRIKLRMFTETSPKGYRRIA